MATRQHGKMPSLLLLPLFVLLALPSSYAGASVGTNVPGDLWTVPSYATYSSNSGFFSEEANAACNINTRALDLTWAQLNPSNETYSQTATGSAQGNTLQSYNTQMAAIGDNPFWMRIFASAWVPSWVVTACGVTAVGQDGDGQTHYPIWNLCVWKYLRTLLRQVFVTWGLAADSRLKLVYVPGAFDWVEFDWDIINLGVTNQGLTKNEFDTWFDLMLSDLVSMFGSNSYKLVFTGEDYQFADDPGPFDSDPFYALRATTAGMGIRTGISELFNFHLNEIPSYGIYIASNGHMVVNESYVLQQSDNGIIATENECYNACGFTISGSPINGMDLTEYAVRMSNLKALQMRVNWLYLVPTDSYMAENSEFYNWVAHSLGKKVYDSPDAWVALRVALDTYWEDSSVYPSVSWNSRPLVHNLERWLYQYDVSPGGLTGNGTLFDDIYDGESSQGYAYEGRRTQHAQGSDYIYFAVDDNFIYNAVTSVSIIVTYLDTGSGSWRIEYSGSGGTLSTPSVVNANTNTYRSVSFIIDDALFGNTLSGNTDFRIYNGGSQDVEVLFVRLVKTNQPTGGGDGDGGSSSASELIPLLAAFAGKLIN